MISAIISSQELSKSRITAEQFLSPNLRTIAQVRKGKYELLPISKIGKVKGGKRLPPNNRYVDTGIPYVRSTDISDLRVDFSQVAHISPEQQKIIARYPLEYLDVVVGIAGTIGTIGIVDENVGTCQFNENLARITEININPFYLAVYLYTDLGQAYISYLRGGAVQPKLSLNSINKIEVPIPPIHVQENISEEIQAAFLGKRKKFLDSDNLLKELGTLVLNRLGVDPGSIQKSRSIVKNIREISGGRFDFEAVAANVEIKFNGFPTLLLSQVVQRITERILPKEECPDDYVNYISLGNIAAHTGELVAFEQVKGSEILSSSIRFSKGDILFGRMRPYLNKVWIAEFDGICTGEAVVLRPNLEKVDVEFLHALLMSRLTLNQIIPFQSGSSLPRVSPSHILNTKLPIPDDINFQKKISTEISQQRNRAKLIKIEAENIVESAKTRVKRMILGETAV